MNRPIDYDHNAGCVVLSVLVILAIVALYTTAIIGGW